ncbi:MAG: hypothetical protein ACTSUR_05140 [Candidatus Heimdallarchaeaceae archaeon]
MHEKKEEVKAQLDMTLGAFLENYDQEIGKGYVDTTKFEGFDQILLDLSIVKSQPIEKINLKEKVKWWKRICRKYKS